MPEQTLLVTGGAGFIGSNFIPYFLNRYPQYRIVNVDKLTAAADLRRLESVENHPRYQFVRGDIANRELMAFVFTHFDVKGVIHFAAESHVDNSIADPEVVVGADHRGKFNMLGVARTHWMEEPFRYRDDYRGCRFHHISTDEVYGTLGRTGFFTEESPYAPNSPYSASKASSDMLVRSYHHTYGLDVVTTNCSNNYGPKQHSEKFIPTVIRKALAFEPIPIYGDGKNVRDWLYVLDHCKGIDQVFHRGKSGGVYNIGGKNEWENIEVARKICDILDRLVPPDSKGAAVKSYKELIQFVKDRPGHDRRYAIDASKIENELGWRAEEDFERGLAKTVEWYVKHAEG
jgi:dTDP-glucose 4,6-dehydratase